MVNSFVEVLVVRSWEKFVCSVWFFYTLAVWLHLIASPDTSRCEHGYVLSCVHFSIAKHFMKNKASANAVTVQSF